MVSAFHDINQLGILVCSPTLTRWDRNLSQSASSKVFLTVPFTIIFIFLVRQRGTVRECCLVGSIGILFLTAIRNHIFSPHSQNLAEFITHTPIVISLDQARRRITCLNRLCKMCLSSGNFHSSLLTVFPLWRYRTF